MSISAVLSNSSFSGSGFNNQSEVSQLKVEKQKLEQRLNKFEKKFQQSYTSDTARTKSSGISFLASPLVE